MLRTLSTSNMAELMTRAPSVWDNYNPAIDEQRRPTSEFADPTETPIEHMTFVLNIRITEILKSKGEVTFVVTNSMELQTVLNAIKFATAA